MYDRDSSTVIHRGECVDIGPLDEILVFNLFGGLYKYGRIRSGSVAEWLKAHDSKSCGQKCLGGSNPLASAKNVCIDSLVVEC